MLATIIFFVGRLGKSCFILPYMVAYFPAIYLHLEGVANIRYFTHETWNGIKWNMENKTTNLIEWTVEDVKKEIQKTFNKDVAKKFEGKIKIMSLRSAKVQTRSLETSLSFR